MFDAFTPASATLCSLLVVQPSSPPTADETPTPASPPADGQDSSQDPGPGPDAESTAQTVPPPGGQSIQTSAARPTPWPAPPGEDAVDDPPAPAEPTPAPAGTSGESPTPARTKPEDGGETMAGENAVPPDEPQEHWWETIGFGAFADAYGAVNYNFPSPPQDASALRAFDPQYGFSLAWAGINVARDWDKAGLVVDLRFGAGPNAGWADPDLPGIQHVKQGYGTWKPHPRVEIDLGRFDTIYGAEVAESWMNATYSRGMLYNLAQPFWHTGLRIRTQPTDWMAITGLAVNGWGYVIDNNRGKTFGLQFGFYPRPEILIAAGYLGGPESPEEDPVTGDRISASDQFRHLADLVIAGEFERFSFAFNADYVHDNAPAELGGDSQWYGAMLSGHVWFKPWVGLGLRGEFLGDPDGWMTGTESVLLGSATASLDFRPGQARVLWLRLEGRYDGSNESLFRDGYQGTANQQVTTTLGLVVSTF